MAEPDPDLVRRFEEVVSENERLRERLAYLEPAIGYTAALVELATAVRAWEQQDTPETRAEVLRRLHDYDRHR